MTSLCNLNGEILDERAAAIPVLDRGFLFGDSVYEVMRTRSGVPFAWAEHLDRLRASAAGIGLELDLDDREILARVKRTLARAGNAESYIRVIVTRGTGTAANIDLAFAPGPPNWVILVRDLSIAARTAKLAVIPRLRTDRRALDPGIKSGNYLNNLLGLAEAKARGATDCLFLNHEGQLTEASTANFFMVRGETVYTPPLRAGLLRGITRTLLFDLCDSLGLPVREQHLTPTDLAEASEVFLTSTLREIIPVTEVDGRSMSDGATGPLTGRLIREFETYCDRYGAERDAPVFSEV